MPSKITTSRPLLILGLIIGSICVGIICNERVRNFYKKLFSHASPDYLQANKFNDEGITYFEQGKIPEAIAAFQKALNLQPETTKILLNLGKAFAIQEKYADAIALYQTALIVEPRYIQAYITLSNFFIKIQKYDQAIKHIEAALKLDPKNYEALLVLSVAYMESNQFDKALATAKKAVTCDPKRTTGYLQVGHICNKVGNIENAKMLYQAAIDLDPQLAVAHFNLGYCFLLLKQIEQAIKSFETAVSLNADYIDAHMGLAECYWILGDFIRVAEKFTIRYKIVQNNKPPSSIPLWQGEDLKGKKVLVSTDHGGGIGDTLQFIRFAQLFKAKGATVICKTQKALVPLLSTCRYLDTIITQFDDKPDYDYIVPILNAPHFIVENNSVIPADIPYLKANQQLTQEWAQKLAHDTGFKIGLCWHVDPRHETIKSPWALRSVAIKDFIPLAQLPHTHFYSLQKNYGEDQLKNLPDYFKVKTFGPHFDEENGRFMDTAAVMMNLDLIITVDTSIAHVAGALGKQVWMLLPYACDCRWGIEGNSTRWYPTMKLFRQPKPGDWTTVIEQVKVALMKFKKV